MKRTLTILLAASLTLATLGMTASPAMAADGGIDAHDRQLHQAALDADSTDGPITEITDSTDGPITELAESSDGPITELVDSSDGPITASSPITSTDVGTWNDCDSKTDPVCE